MSKKIPYQKNDENKKDINQKSEKKEKENTFLIDVQLLSSLKSIPGKIIPLSNVIKPLFVQGLYFPEEYLSLV